MNKNKTIKKSTKDKFKIKKDWEKCVDTKCGHIIKLTTQRKIMKQCKYKTKCMSKTDKKFFSKIKKRTKCIKNKCKSIQKKYEKSISNSIKQNGGTKHSK